MLTNDTVVEILNGKQMYQALEAHTVSLFTLYSLYFGKFLKYHPNGEASSCLGEAHEEDINLDPESRHHLTHAVAKKKNTRYFSIQRHIE